jgi:uncharacterized protein (TIGR03118 family)
MWCIRVMLIVSVITGGVICSAPPLIADTDNAYARRTLVVNRHDPADPTSPPPWDMAVAPANFGPFSRALLVGNFGDGTIVGFDLTTGKQIDYLRDPQGDIIGIDGLWALFFGNGASLGRADFLDWTADFNDETDGGFGSLN